MVYVFGYGSLVDRGSVEASIGRPLGPQDGPHPVRLRGYRRAWNVSTPTTVRPELTFWAADGSEWTGSLGWLGIEPAPRGSALGAVSRVSERDLAVLDARELSYDRIEVGSLLDGVVPGMAGEPVFTYRPTAAAVARARAAGTDTVVMTRYLRLLERGFRALGDALYAEHVRTLPPPAPFTVAEITATSRDPSVRIVAVDPAHD